MNVEQFVRLIENKHVQVKIKLKKLSSIYYFFGIEMREYHGKEKEVWCEIEPINDFNSLSYKIFCNPIEKDYKGRDYYTMDMIQLIEKDIVKLRIVYDEKYNSKLGE